MAVANGPSGREAKRLQTRERLMGAAIAEFKRSGMAEADVGAIVAAAGMANVVRLSAYVSGFQASAIYPQFWFGLLPERVTPAHVEGSLSCAQLVGHIQAVSAKSFVALSTVGSRINVL